MLVNSSETNPCATRISGRFRKIAKNLQRGKLFTNLLPVGHFDLPAERIITDRGQSTVLLALNLELLISMFLS